MVRNTFSRKVLLLFLPVVWVYACTGCCSVVHWGFSQKIRVSSSPSEADIIIDDVYRGKTPSEVYVKRHDVHQVLIRKDGYQPYEASTKRDLCYWIFGNLLLVGGLGIIGFVVDGAGGSMYHVDPGSIHAELATDESRHYPDSAESSSIGTVRPSSSATFDGSLSEQP